MIEIKYHGIVSHDNLYESIKYFDCLILPFKLNNLVNSVDPVKLYEYINFNKTIISIYYKELDYFSQFIYFYSNNDEFINLLKKMVKDKFTKKYSESERKEFLAKNAWNIRNSEIIDSLEKL